MGLRYIVWTKPDRRKLSKSFLNVGGKRINITFSGIACFAAHKFLQWQRLKRTKGLESPRVKGENTIPELSTKYSPSRFFGPAELDGRGFNGQSTSWIVTVS